MALMQLVHVQRAVGSMSMCSASGRSRCWFALVPVLGCHGAGLRAASARGPLLQSAKPKTGVLKRLCACLEHREPFPQPLRPS